MMMMMMMMQKEKKSAALTEEYTWKLGNCFFFKGKLGNCMVETQADPEDMLGAFMYGEEKTHE